MATIIIGGGLAGLMAADGLIQAGLQGEIIILEKYGYIGGRIVSGKRPDGTTYEIGAGRFHKSHTRVIQLIHRFGLTSKMKPIENSTYWKSTGDIQPNKFLELWSAYLPIFRSLPDHILANSTLKEIATKILGKKHTEYLFNMLPYRSEIEILRADIALESDIFLSSGFFYLEGGLHQIIRKLMDYLLEKGVIIHKNTAVSNILKSGRNYIVKTKTKQAFPDASRVILALHINALRSLPIFKGSTLLNYVQMAPLTRIYAQFPVPWNIPRLVTDSPLRYIIPIQPQKGIVMISYTDGRDTDAWKGFEGTPLQKKIVSEIRSLFPDSPVIKPTWSHSYEWKDGCSYWVPGDYDPRKISHAALCPLPDYPNLYLCGESFSMNQAWMEGSLEHVEELMRVIQTTSVYPAA